MCTAPGTCATTNCIAGRVSTTTAPSCCNRRTSEKRQSPHGRRFPRAETLLAGSVPPRAKYSGRGGRLSVSRWMNSSRAGCLQRIVGGALFPDGGRALGAHLPPAQRSRAMRRKNLSLIRQLEQLVVQAAVQHGGEILRCVVARKIGTSYIADKQRVAGEHGSRPRGIARSVSSDTDAFQRMAGSLQKIEAAIAERE